MGMTPSPLPPLLPPGDPVRDPHSAREAVQPMQEYTQPVTDPTVPEALEKAGWRVAHTSSGSPYFFNAVTGDSSWTLPQAEPVPPLPWNKIDNTTSQANFEAPRPPPPDRSKMALTTQAQLRHATDGYHAKASRIVGGKDVQMHCFFQPIPLLSALLDRIEAMGVAILEHSSAGPQHLNRFHLDSLR